MISLQKEITELLTLAELLFKGHKRPFDFTLESLQVIRKICQEERVPDNDDSAQIPIDRKLLALGIYVGETIRKHVADSTWDEEVKDIKDISITFMNGSKIWPVKRVINCWKSNFVDEDIFTYTKGIIAEEVRKLALRKEKKKTKAWWQFWK